MGNSAPVPVSPENAPTKQKILDAALQIVEEQGISALTQPRVAKLAGVRQSHLTYYFPRKSDLLLGALEASHQKANGHTEHQPSNKFRDIAPFIENLMFEPKRARFFFSVLLGVSEDAELRPTIASHARGFTAFLAPYFQRPSDDPQVQLFVDLLRGIALSELMEPYLVLLTLAELAESFELL